MNQLFYNIAGGSVHQIRREKQTTISEVIVRGKRNIKQNRNWFYFKFSVESSSFYCNLNTKFFIFKKEITLKNGALMAQEWRSAHAIIVHYQDFEHAYIY